MIMGHIAMGTYTLNLQGNAASLNPVDLLAQSAAPGPMSSSTDSAPAPTKTGSAPSLKSIRNTVLLGGILSFAAFAPFF
jgi:hypothetical protein